jgi:hypothetical protein
MENLHLLPEIHTREERIQAKIDSFKKEFMLGDGDIYQAEELLHIIIEYLSEFENDPMLEQAYIKLNESFFWLSSYNSDT